MKRKIPIYQVDAFAGEVFAGNPAAVCPLDEWLPEATMQAIAAENNLSETAFFVRGKEGFALRWFTPKTEVDLCGHATLASAFVIFSFLLPSAERVLFFSPRSGELLVTKEKELLCLDFPAKPPAGCAPPQALLKGLGAEPLEVLQAEDYLAVFGSEKEVKALRPDMAQLKKLDRRGVIVTARGERSDFVCRFFAPKLGIEEDPVTGSAYCTLVPFWQERTGKSAFFACQVSQRGGEVFCQDRGSRVLIGGRAVLYLEGTITF